MAASNQRYFWELVIIPFHCGKSGRLHSSSLYKFKLFETEAECLKDAEEQLDREKPDKFANNRESLRIIIKKTQHLGGECLANASNCK